MQSFGRIEQVEARQVYSLEVAGSSPAPATSDSFPLPAAGKIVTVFVLYLVFSRGTRRIPQVMCHGARTQGTRAASGYGGIQGGIRKER